MRLTDLRYLVALAREANFSRAAEQCGVSQPTLSVAIARIEEELAVQLFERGKAQVTPTEVGRQVVVQARKALEAADEVRHIARRGRNPLEGALRLGIIHTIAPYLLPDLICNLRHIAPAMPLAIEENMTTVLAALLQASELDVAIIALPFELPGVLTRALYDEPFHVIVPRGHRWEAHGALRPEEVTGDEVLLLKAGNCFRDQVMGACPQLSSPDSDLRLGHTIGTIRCMVASGLGVSVLPEAALGRPYSDDMISVIPFVQPAPTRRVALAWRTGFVRPKAIDALIEAVRGIDNPAFRHLGQ